MPPSTLNAVFGAARAVMALVITSVGVSVPEVALLGSLFRWRLLAALVVSVFAVAVGSGAIFALVLG